MPPGRRKAHLEDAYARIIKVYKSDPEIEWQQIRDRFGIGHRKIIELREQALGKKE